MKIAYTFPGQGSQFPGMWAKLGESEVAKEIFQTTDTIAGFPLSQLCFDDNRPIEILTETQNAQPATVAHSLASLAVARENNSLVRQASPAFYLGHSVNELSALAAAGVITTEEAIYLSVWRGVLMQQYGGEGKMAAMIGRRQDVEDICKITGAEAVNFNGPLQTVISGTAEQVDQAISKARGRMQTKVLQVSRAFHNSKLMGPVLDKFAKVVAPIDFKDPKAPVISNITAKPCESGDEIKRLLPIQLVSPVEWQKSVEYVLEQGVKIFVEFGPKDVLTGLLKRINREARGFWVGDIESAQSLIR